MNLGFLPPGPVAAAFLEDRSEVSAIMGPMGSGKTSTVLMKLVRLCAGQAPSPVDNVRYTKVGVVRETTTNLKRTTIKSIKEWFGENAGEWYGGGSSAEPLSFKIKFKLPDDTIAQVIFEFIGLDGNNIEDMAKGWEITHYWLNEADLLSPDVKMFLDGRVGRYPHKKHGGPTFYCGLLDYNAPDVENYMYKLFEEERPEGHAMYRQPGGNDVRAENVQNLPEGYYERMARGKPRWWVRRNIDNEYGFSREGEPVYENYRDEFHCGRKIIEHIPGLPVKMYADAETHPAIIFTQNWPNGQRVLLGEVYIRGGAKQLGQAALEYAAKHFPGAKLMGGTVDPSAARMNPHDSDAGDWIETLNKAMGLTGDARFTKAPTNDISKRHDAVDDLLTHQVDGGPALLVSALCLVARKGFNSTYCFKRMANKKISEKPTKDHPVSDVHDAIQYWALDDGGYEKLMVRDVVSRQRADWSRPRQAKLEVRV